MIDLSPLFVRGHNFVDCYNQDAVFCQFCGHLAAMRSLRCSRPESEEGIKSREEAMKRLVDALPQSCLPDPRPEIEKQLAKHFEALSREKLPGKAVPIRGRFKRGASIGDVTSVIERIKDRARGAKCLAVRNLDENGVLFPIPDGFIFWVAYFPDGADPHCVRHGLVGVVHGEAACSQCYADNSSMAEEIE